MVGFNEIYSRIGKLNSLSYALEGAVLEVTADLEASPEKERMMDLFYLLLEEYTRLKKDADELSGHITVKQPFGFFPLALVETHNYSVVFDPLYRRISILF